jgi:succinoglycan biosynthesis protein ExoO
MSSVLFVTRHTPLPWEDGAGAYLHDVARFLAAHGCRVEVLWLAPPDHLRWQKWWRLPGAFDASVRLRLPGALRCGRLYLFPAMIWYPFKARALHRARRLLAALGVAAPRRAAAPAIPPGERPWMSPPTAAELALVEKQVRTRRPAAVIASYAWLCPIFQRPALQSARHVCLTHDVAWHRARLAAAEAGANVPAAISREDEAGWLRCAQTIVAISAPDAAELRALVPTAAVLLAPKACAPSAENPPEPDLASPRLLFVGSGNLFNTAGLAWFLLEVWPRVRASLPGTRLDVCGSVDRAVTLRPAGVVFHGSVPELAPFYRAAGVVIVPLLRATGLNIKLVEAAAAGRAIVASTVTLAGAPFLRDAVLGADSAAGFAAALGLLLTDAGANRTAAAAGLAAVRRHLSPAACYGPLLAHLRPAA